MDPINKIPTKPFGTWNSPITDEMITSDSIVFTEVSAAPDGSLYVVESRPSDGGKCHIVQWRHGQDILPPGYSARSAVHGYGGGAIAPLADSKRLLVFSDAATNGVYILECATRRVRAAIKPNAQVYFADFDAHPNCEWVLAVCEDHQTQIVTNTIVAINLAQQNAMHTIAAGADFYAHPRFNPKGDRICWIQWNHPNMPWTGSELFVAPWQRDDGTIGKPILLAGQKGRESIAQPRWAPDGTLFFVSDCSGYWQLWRWHPDWIDDPRPIPIELDGLETGEFAGPEWWLGSSTYVFLDSDTIVATWTHSATEHLLIIHLATWKYEFLTGPAALLTGIADSAIAVTSPTSVAILACTPTSPQALYHLDVRNPASSLTMLRSSTTTTSVPAAMFSPGRPISFPRSTASNENKDIYDANAFFFSPQNPHYKGPKGCLPPLIISIHGGPTLHSGPGLSLQWQYYTTRGFAVALLNYAGSSGYGRKYRDLLDGQLGVLDVHDAADCAHYLVSAGLVNPSAIGITGGSSGGYAALSAICQFPSLWAGAVSISGISDVEALVRDTHKFESFYALRLIFGGEHIPEEECERQRVYRQRSPRYLAAQKGIKIIARTLLLQGTEDHIVPVDQAKFMAHSIQSNGGVAKLVLFEGEGHGWPRKAENALLAVREQSQWWRESLAKQEVSVSRQMRMYLVIFLLFTLAFLASKFISKSQETGF